jgi:uncharacterized integral membrane protein
MNDRQPRRPDPAKPETNWKRWGLLVLVALALIVILQNSQEVSFNLLFINTSAPLILLLLIFTMVGAAIGYFGPMVRRGREKN